jgi:predicted acylesterase/phospholipase RssA
MGIDSMDGIREVLHSAVERHKKSGDLTMKELHDVTGTRFTCYATNLCTRTLHKFDSFDTPHVPVVDAVCASMCVPFVFTPVVVDDAMFLDGAVMCALPPNPPGATHVISAKTVGPPSHVELTNNKPSNAVDLAKQLVSIMVTLSNDATTHALMEGNDSDSKRRHDHIDIPVDDDGIFVADGRFLSVDEKHVAKLIHRGYVRAREVLKQ